MEKIPETARVAVDYIEWAGGGENRPKTLGLEVGLGGAVENGRLDWDLLGEKVMSAIEAAGGAKCDAAGWDLKGETVDMLARAGVELDDGLET